jgi:GNAT superfamily N-acetyltransferase
MKVKIVQAESEEQIQQARDLFTEYAEWVMTHEDVDPESVQRVFTYQGLQQELAELPGKYVPPDGRLLIAIQYAETAGCVALRKIDRGICEMKRMWIRPEFRGKGIGRALAETVIDEARKIGYTRMCLDTGKFMKEAPALYRSLGFKDIEPYYEIPNEMRKMMDFMELSLQ